MLAIAGAVILIAAAAVVFSYRNLLSLLPYAGISAEELEEKNQAVRRAEEEIRNTYRIPEITLTPEEQAALDSSEKSAKEIAENLLQGQKGTGQAGLAAPSGRTPEDDSEQIQSLVAQLYVLQNVFTSRVDSVIDECKAEYRALDKSQQTKDNKMKIVSGKLDVFSAMEKDCDVQVAAIIKEVEAIDADLAKTLQSQYTEAKNAKKAGLISRYS